MKKIELLAPAGDLKKLKMAVLYGADAVYLGGEKYSLRAGAKNFSLDEMKDGINFAHSYGKKVYITANIVAQNADIDGVKEYFEQLYNMKADAIIVSDPAFLLIAKKYIPDMELHLSTQANTTNFMTANFWHYNGIKRIVPARELSFKELVELKEKINPNLEIEIFVHGAMCMSYSGRCLISSFLTGRDANRGDCAQPCRWKYSLVEEKRPGEYFPVIEDERGSFFFNSKDLCLIQEIDKIIEAGIDSIKIEGRVKSAYYVATIVRSYRKAIDDYYADPENYKFDETLLDEIKKASYRNFTKAFFYDSQNMKDSQNYESSSYVQNYDFVGFVKKYDDQKQMAVVQQRNKFQVGDEVEIIGPHTEMIKTKIYDIHNLSGEKLDVSNVPMQEVYVDFKTELKENYIIRRVKDNLL